MDGSPLGFCRVTDNVTRRREFERRHPSVVIAHREEPSWLWTATWYDNGVRRQVTDPELGPLLDQLDAMTG